MKDVAKMKVTIKAGRSGLLEQEGPVRATKSELAELESFTKLAATWGLLGFLPRRALGFAPGSGPVGGGPIPLAPQAPLISP